MTIRTPNEIKSILHSGFLELPESQDAYADVDGWGGPDDSNRGETLQAGNDRRLAYTIGQPQWGKIEDYHQSQESPLPGSNLGVFQEADFFVVQFAMSLRPQSNVLIKDARFGVSLASETPHVELPIALDLHPLKVVEEHKQEVKVKIAPSLKFEEVAEVGLGEINSTVVYTHNYPQIVASGVLEPSFEWKLNPTPKIPLVGARFFYAIVKRPKGINSVRANFNLEVTIEVPHGLFLLKTEIENSELTCNICS